MSSDETLNISNYASFGIELLQQAFRLYEWRFSFKAAILNLQTIKSKTM